MNYEFMNKEELLAELEERDKELNLAEDELSDLRCGHEELLEARLEEAADTLADAGLLINTPNFKYRWIQEGIGLSVKS